MDYYFFLVDFMLLMLLIMDIVLIDVHEYYRMTVSWVSFTRNSLGREGSLMIKLGIFHYHLVLPSYSNILILICHCFLAVMFALLFFHILLALIIRLIALLYLHLLVIFFFIHLYYYYSF